MREHVVLWGGYRQQTTTENAIFEAGLNLRFAESGTKNVEDLIVILHNNNNNVEDLQSCTRKTRIRSSSLTRGRLRWSLNRLNPFSLPTHLYGASERL